jgi:polyphenol oxidase
MIKSIYPNWPAPQNIRAFTTTRIGGISLPPFGSLNLGSRTGDDLNNIIENRRRIIKGENIPSEPHWLNQTHSTTVLDISKIQVKPATGMIGDTEQLEADGSYTTRANQVSVVLTADCMPVLFCSAEGKQVAAAHAGWRGLCHGILEETAKKFKCNTNEILVWLGPAISVQKFEVGVEVKKQFEEYNQNAHHAFKLIDAKQQKYLADLYMIAKQRLNAIGISQIYGGNYCTHTEHDLFYSYRRENKTGRMATMIWFE